jgi:hypothetical protein
MLRSTAVAAVLAVSLLSACGSSGSGDATTDVAAAAPAATTPVATAPAETPTTAAATPTTTTAAAPKLSKAELLAKCHATLDGTIDDLKDLDSVAKIDSGYTKYNTQVLQAQTAFRNMTFQNAPKSGNCMQLVLANAAQSLTHYVNATLAWSKCAAQKSCKDSSIAPDLRKEWTQARALMHDAEAAFAKSHT